MLFSFTLSRGCIRSYCPPSCLPIHTLIVFDLLLTSFDLFLVFTFFFRFCGIRTTAISLNGRREQWADFSHVMFPISVLEMKRNSTFSLWGLFLAYVFKPVSDTRKYAAGRGGCSLWLATNGCFLPPACFLSC
jgi:hypothetical protein